MYGCRGWIRTLNTCMKCIQCTTEFSPRQKSQRFCSKSCSARFTNKLKPKQVREARCICCDQLFNLTSYKQKFCSKSCAASHNNARNPAKSPSRIKQARTLSQIPREVKPSSPTIKQRTCITCNRVDTIVGKGSFRIKECKFCSSSLTYRQACTFTFDLRKYPNEFDLSLLARFGVFNPKTNPLGMTRDHRLSIQFGKDNGIDPKIMSHPANCELMTQAQNSKKHSSSSISLPQLLEAIELWEMKHGSGG